MNLKHASGILRIEAEVHHQAALEYARNQLSCSSVFDASSGQKFHEGAADAYGVVAHALQLVEQCGGSFEDALVAAQSCFSSSNQMRDVTET